MVLTKKGGQVVALSRGELGRATEPEAVREETVDHVKVGGAHRGKNGRVAREEREN